MKYSVLFSVVFMFLCAPANAMGLKESSVVNKSTITLGDVFYDLPRDESRVLGAAPMPGKDMIINARTLLRIALALDLPWRPSSSAERIVIRRDATVIGYEQIKESLNTALYDHDVYGDYELSIPTQYQSITLPADQPATLEITRMDVNMARQTFEVSIAAPSAQNPIQHMRISGRIVPVISLPVLRENIQNGRIITKADVEYIKVRENSFTQTTIADMHGLIGMTARRVLIAGRPIKASDIVAPQVIERGEFVTLALVNGMMNLTTQVKALQSGGKGDVIRVLNTGSNKTLQARIVASGEVVVLN